MIGRLFSYLTVGSSALPVIIGATAIAAAGAIILGIILHDARQAERGEAIEKQHEQLETDLETKEKIHDEIEHIKPKAKPVPREPSGDAVDNAPADEPPATGSAIDQRLRKDWSR